MPPLIVIGGATATGKTELAIRLAEAIERDGRPAEIISADSRQVFRGLDIGTAKVSAADRARVAHHGLDLVEPDAAVHGRRLRPARARASSPGWPERRRRDPGRRDRLLPPGGRPRSRHRALPSDPALRARLEADQIRDGLEAQVARLQRPRPDPGVPDRPAQHAAGRPGARDRRAARGTCRLPAPRGYPGPAIWLGLTVEPADHAPADRRPCPGPVRRRPDRGGASPA